MRKFLLGLLVGAVLSVMAGVIFFFATVRFSEEPPSMPNRALLVLAPNGSIPEIAPVEVPFGPFATGSPLSVYDYWDLCRRAARDERIAAVLLRPRGLSAGWGKLEELRKGIEILRQAGKPVYALLEAGGTREYYVASAATRLFMTPEDLLDLKGLRIEAQYYRGTLDKLGVEVEVEHMGKYKDAADSFSRKNMTAETREVLNSILDGTFQRLAVTLGKARGKSEAEFKAIVDDGPFLAPQAKARGLIDELAYEDQIEQQLKTAAKADKLVRVSHSEYLKTLRAEGEGGSRRPRVALVVAQGDIVRGGGSADFLGEQQAITPRGLAAQLKAVGDDDAVRGVVLRVDSPGGDAIASDEILREVRALSKKKPMVISMSDLAASGGYYIAMSGDPIVAYPGTLTGSIGVVYGKVNLKGLYEKLGIHTEILKRGRFADVDSSAQALSPEGRKKLQDSLQFIYDGFLKRVSEGRKMDVGRVHELAQGRVWLGSQAQGNQLVDHLGGLDEAFVQVRKRAGIAEGERLRIVVYPRPRSFWETLLRRRTTETDLVVEEIRSRLVSGLAPWLDGGFLRVLPFRLEIR